MNVVRIIKSLKGRLKLIVNFEHEIKVGTIFKNKDNFYFILTKIEAILDDPDHDILYHCELTELMDMKLDNLLVKMSYELEVINNKDELEELEYYIQPF